MGENGRERRRFSPLLVRSRLFSSVLARSRLFSSVLALFGMPDYQAYCAHLRDRHPDQPVLSEREFFDEFLRARYSDGPTRCC
jgi:uncharacterized short protein YbdD (DUF466 family)